MVGLIRIEQILNGVKKKGEKLENGEELMCFISMNSSTPTIQS